MVATSIFLGSFLSWPWGESLVPSRQEILLKANEAEMKQNLNYVGRCEVWLEIVLEQVPVGVQKGPKVLIDLMDIEDLPYMFVKVNEASIGKSK